MSEKIDWQLVEEILTRSSPPRTTLRTFISDATLPVPTFLIASNTANMSLPCGRWVQIIFAWGLGLVQYENLNKGRAAGPCVTVDTVDADEGAIGSAGLLSFHTQTKTGDRPFCDRAIKEPWFMQSTSSANVHL